MIDVTQPPLSVEAQKSLYDAISILIEAGEVNYDSRDGKVAERAGLCALLNMGWTLEPPVGAPVSAGETTGDLEGEPDISGIEGTEGSDTARKGDRYVVLIWCEEEMHPHWRVEYSGNDRAVAAENVLEVRDYCEVRLVDTHVGAPWKGAAECQILT